MNLLELLKKIIEKMSKTNDESENIENDQENELDNELNELDIDLDNIDIESVDIETDDIETIESDEKETDFEIMFKNTANKHKQDGAHALKRDVILKGKKEESEEDQEMSSSTHFYNDSYKIEDYDSYHSEDAVYKKSLIKDIYNILNDDTDIDFLANRRKPNKKTFNNFYEMCLLKLDMNYTKSEIFVELSYYFTDNIFNMFKLLNKKNASGIIIELKDKGYLSDIGNINFI